MKGCMEQEKNGISVSIFDSYVSVKIKTFNLLIDD
jgi:hypothetical protein